MTSKLLMSVFLCFIFYSSIFAQNLKNDNTDYKSDILGPDFMYKTICMGRDKDGEVVISIVKYIAAPQTEKAILYIHGYNDYFFQSHAAKIFASKGYRFYAIDLRRYGRSLRPYQYPFAIRNLHEYFGDIDSAVNILKGENCKDIILMGHSTGGLISSLYAHHKDTNIECKALILNSPFLDMNLSKSFERLTPLVSCLGAIFPKAKMKTAMSTAYAESLLIDRHGEWEFDTLWKFPLAPPLTMSWVRAIHRGHVEIKKKIDIKCPVLLMSSDKSIYGDLWTEEHQKGDAVLDVNDIQSLGKTMGKDIRPIVIKDGLHDLLLSNPLAREAAFDSIFSFLNAINL